MARGINPARLAKVIQDLQQERRGYQRRIEEIDSIFAKCGIVPTDAAAPQRGRPPRGVGRAKAARATGGKRGLRGRQRGKFETSGTQSVVDFVKSCGRGGALSSDISAHWKGEGRAGEPYITLGHLVKSGKLKKKSLKGQRGSRYTAA